MIVTGANTGIGYETALALYEAGAHVVLAGRSMENTRQAIEKIQKPKGAGSLEAGLLDLADLDSVRLFAEGFLKSHRQLHVLINNAGVMIPPLSKTTAGFELQFGVNFLGHFALTGHLYPLLKATPGSRIVTLSSNAYLRGNIDFDNLRAENSYDPMREYCQSKLANMIFAIELQRRITAANDKILSVAAQPGANNTDLSRYMDKAQLTAAIERVGPLMEAWQGALPSLYAAVSPDVAGGDFYEPDGDGGYRGYPTKGTIASHALDEAVAQRLWSLGGHVTGVRFPG
jgi:NAD(P)-dependent dehydrogenase (short-subunit alcohol dehydrogenase family)